MTRRPNPFNQQAMEEVLRDLGCPESLIPSTISNYRLFVPLLFTELGEERVYQLVSRTRDELTLGEQEEAWRSSIKYIVAWAETVMEQYKHKRSNAPKSDSPDDKQPRLL